jgi:hypothetical protein
LRLVTLYELVLARAQAERERRRGETKDERARRHEEWLAKMLKARLNPRSTEK